jgi:phospholipase/lecithinase/hemolysin
MAAAMLSACGGASSTVEPFVATRVIAFGDGFNYVDNNGSGVSTVQTTDVTASPIVYVTDDTIAGRIALKYGLVVKQVSGAGSTSLAATGGFGYATASARVADVDTQIQNFLHDVGGTVAKKDLIVISVGNWDIKAAVASGTPVADIDTATTNLVTAIQRLTAAGAEHVVVMPAINMARTPWARTTPNGKTLAQIEQLSITTESSPNLNSFNSSLLLKLSRAYTQDRKPVYLLDRSSDFNNFAGYSTTDGTTRVVNYSGLVITADTGLYVPVCTAHSLMAGCALADLDTTTSPLTATSYQSYVFADDINLTPLANRFLADRMIYTMQSFGWAP